MARKLSFYYLRRGAKESVETDDFNTAHTRVRASGRDIGREQECRPHEGMWCASCDFQEFCPAKARNPRPVPTENRARHWDLIPTCKLDSRQS